ncbi:MAG: YHYH protein [Pirellulales bacterium]
MMSNTTFRSAVAFTFKLTAIIAIALSAAVNKPALAHEGGHGVSSQAIRLWHRVDGTHFHGSFISADDDELRVLTERGLVQRFPLEQLSQRSLLWIADQQVEIERINTSPRIKLVSLNTMGSPTTENNEANMMPNQVERPKIASSFSPFEKTVGLRWDRDFLYVESNGIPEHQMMVGIRSWQQQVPLPQAYRGDNAWRIPLNPVPAKKPATAKGQFLRGAIALAVNGIPIFNPLNNRGDDAYQFGELDEFGGHCGRADDYHYHIAPIHLEKIVGKGQPIAYALDGYPILGYQDPGAPDFAPLDWLNGHKDAQGNYHYHATPKYPYINGGFYGQVVERDGQVDPQPRAEPVRPSLPPMQGAKITDFQQAGQTSTLTYQVNGKQGTVQYTQKENGSVDFVFTDTSGKSKSDSYQTRGRQPGQRRGGGGPERGGPERGGPPQDRGTPERGTKPEQGEGAAASSTKSTANAFGLTSSSIDTKGFLLIDCTCDGKKQSPAIAWSDLPAGTKTVAISLWHTAPDQEKSYWLAYNIPADIKGIEQNGLKTGTLGLNDKKRAEYDPMCSKGPGVKTYHITVYALSSQLDIKPDQMNRKRLLDEVKKHKLGESTLDFNYERK